jgi:DUF1680 family protein
MNVIKIICSALLLALAIACSTKSANTTVGIYPITPIDIKNVVLTDSFWLPKVRLIQETTIKHAFEKCHEDGRMENFLIAGGKMEGKARGVMPFDDTDLYKIIEGGAYSLINMPNPTLDAYMDSIIAIIAVGQEPDGYITTWFTIDRENPTANWVKPSKRRWENEVTSHELYNSGHLFEAAAAHYWATGKKNFLDIALKNADLLVNNFQPGLESIPPGHQIAETGLIKLYDITGKKEYLTLAKYLLDLRGDSTTHTLFGSYSQDHLPVIEQKEAVGHAVRAVYQYAGMTDIVAHYQDEKYLNALHAIWDNTTTKKTYVTGGIGAVHDGERFGENYELPNLTAYAETCASIGSVWWNQKMFMLSGDVKYYDVLERTLYNGVIAGISTDGTKFFYPNALESDGIYKFNRGSATRQSWFDCSCCPTNMIRFLPSLAGFIYATQSDTVYTNLFISSDATLSIGKNEINVRQVSGYPWNGNVSMDITPTQNANFTLRIRIPGWLRNEVLPTNLYSYVAPPASSIQLTINGEQQTANIQDGYVSINRTWKKGDNVSLELPMEVRKVTTLKDVAENAGKVAYERGPFVYCAEGIDNPTLTTLALPTNLEWNVQKTSIGGEQAKLLSAQVQNENIVLIPYYLWSNRGVNSMKVWLPEINN